MQRIVILDLPIKDDGTFKNSKAKQDLQEKINHNTVLYNVIVRDGSRVIAPGTNLINYEGRSIFKKQPSEHKLLKRMKSNWKKGILAVPDFHGANTRADFIRAFATSKDPDFYINFIILK